ncbi:sulfite exporter TauE/SafE family protein [Effusibacillus dendaii]|uniref:Probable membrane transporter protein n=1 Tax=Effusibacillus dendaii TaxID=2743772 RepID=A0A7I8DIY5_9BACL|nr:sulfite exporter TauE/SafE family protein [Effusibacillus dendaii]BCJ87801.1 UPF0721 transmembrane protein [Effusibacillus dendaii]
MNLWMIVGGFFVGAMIGMTGMGGGLLMTPLLILGFGVAPSIAVGTDLVFAATTKLFGAWQHWRQKTVDFALLRYVAMGSVPGTLLGGFCVRLLKQSAGGQSEIWMSKTLAIVFLFIALIMILQVIKSFRGSSIHAVQREPFATSHMNRYLVAVIGFLVGFLVAVTSVGSGTLFMALLLYFYPLSVSKLVGTDIVHGVLITALAALIHWGIGTIDLRMVLNLTAGSIIGVLVGSRMSVKIPDLILRIVLIVILVLSSVKLL